MTVRAKLARMEHSLGCVTRCLFTVVTILGGCATSQSAQPAGRLDPTCDAAERRAPILDEAERSKLDGAAQHELMIWRSRLAGVRCRSDQRVDADARRIVVSVAYTGEVGALRAAGLALGYDDGRLVSGSVAFRDIGALANVTGVVRIVMQPEAHTN